MWLAAIHALIVHKDAVGGVVISFMRDVFRLMKEDDEVADNLGHVIFKGSPGFLARLTRLVTPCQ